MKQIKMMENMNENIFADNKSLKSVVGRTADFNEIAKDCVAFANARGGKLNIGIENKCNYPPSNQKIEEDLPNRIVCRLNELTYNVGLQANIITAKNGGQYIELRILRSILSVAATTKGGYFIRDNDKSRSILPDELIRLIADKSTYSWESKATNINWKNCDQDKLAQFVNDIRNSNRISDFIKNKSSYELLEYYVMIDDKNNLTNLGVLWIGKREQRARLLYSPVVQYIKYDARGNKVNKIKWDEYDKNPKELIEAIWTAVPDWKEISEVSKGLWRKEIPAYDEKVVREILCNALVHRPYTTRGDIFIKIYPDYMTVVNPGQFPFGVTASNILQKTVQRNEHMAKLLYALNLMETEGSGYDLMYETLLSSGKGIPVPFEGDDYVEVTINRNIINTEAARIIEYITNHYKVSQKNIIALGIIIQANIINATELSKKLQLPVNSRLRDYVGYLVDEGILQSHGRGKGVKYFVNPAIYSNAKSNITTSLKTIEPYRLKALIEEDLKYYPWSTVSDINKRLPDINIKDLQTMVRKMAIKRELIIQGGRKYRRYNLP